MSFSLYDASIGSAKDACESLLAVISKAESSSAAATIPTARIHPDMLPFHYQVYIFANTVHKMIARVTGAEATEIEAVGESYDSMRSSVQSLQKELEAASRDTVNGRQAETVAVGQGKGKPDGKMESWGYVMGYANPNIYFHLTTAYNIIRKEGVDIGKQDYLAPFMGKKLLQ